MAKKFYVLTLLLVIMFSIFIYRVIDLAYFSHAYYLDKYYDITENYTTGLSAPRGRILDINGKVLVDNIGTNSIVYHKNSDISFNNELEIAKELVLLTNYSYEYQEGKLKDFYILLYPEKAQELITEEETEEYNERKITKEDLNTLKKERITEEMLNELTELEKYSSYFYYLMNDGYVYSNKTILKNVSDELYASILEANLPGIFGEIEWMRVYPYGDTLKSILGSISNSLPKEKEYLLEEGYSYEDKVGISGLEEYYEEYLKGEKAIYKIENNNLTLVSEAKRGYDITLEIDIDIQLEVESIIKEQMEKAKKEVNTEFYKESYALVSNPNTGGIVAVAGIRRLDNESYQDVSINVIKNAYTVGSAVKAASISVGYRTGVIDIGTTYTDSCIKLANLPAKCSYKSLGTIDDIRALALSSNYYQFRIALAASGNNYTYNMKATVEEKDFETYRNIFKEYGLGAKTEIDLPNESTGLQGNIVAPDLLLNLAIGQYDLYTPVELLQYINTIASNGTRLKLNLMHNIKDGENIILASRITELNKVNLEEKYMERIKTGLREVMKSGTGYWYASQSINAVGKTGTSESYIDSNYDGAIDSYVLSNTFIMYAPYDNPKYSIVVISPNTSNLNGKSTYRSPVNRLIARNINDFLFSSS